MSGDSEGVEALTRRMVGLFERLFIANAGEGHELLKNLKPAGQSHRSLTT